MRAFRFLLALFFLILAFYETSGAHPVIWILVFGCMTLLSVLAIFNFFIRPLLAVLLIGFLSFMLFSTDALTNALQHENQVAAIWHNSTIRYFLYAGFCFVICAYYFWQSIQIKSSFNRLQNHNRQG